MFRSQVRCCEHGLRPYPTVFGSQRSVSLGRQVSGSTVKMLLVLPVILKAIGASDIAMPREKPALSRHRFSPLRVLPSLVLLRLAVRSRSEEHTSELQSPYD